MKTVRVMMRIAVVGVLVVAGSFGQNCACGVTNCISWQLSCSNCGYTFCSTGSGENPTTTDKLDACKGANSFACSNKKGPDNNPIVCAQKGQVTQCTIRNIGTTGYRCSDGVLAAYTGTSCCHN